MEAVKRQSHSRLHHDVKVTATSYIAWISALGHAQLLLAPDLGFFVAPS